MNDIFHWAGWIIAVCCVGIVTISILMYFVTKIYTALTDWALVCEYIWYRKDFKAWLGDKKAKRAARLADVNLN